MVRLVGDKAAHVPYRGANALMPDLLAGRLDAFAGAVNSLLPHIRSGALRAVAVLGDARLPTLPDVPTVLEEGLPDARTPAWLSIVLPAGTPRPLVDKIYADAASVIRSPVGAAKLAEQGIEPAIQSPEEVTRTVTEEFERDRALIVRRSIRVD